MFYLSIQGFYFKSAHIPSNTPITILAFHATESELMTALLKKRNLWSVANREGYKHLAATDQGKRGGKHKQYSPTLVLGNLRSLEQAERKGE